ncbi:MAG TPA: glycoside hydrolase family 43 protein [Pseudolysinimonas sp.]|nr:glycoside hydrolase family 43 protein [Pseudolysinimonas sp.]
MAYFRSEQEPDGEQVRFAVSEPGDPLRWTALQGGRPVLTTGVGERGVRDPFLVRQGDGGVLLIATDLRVHPDHDWDRAMYEGSRAIQTWSSRDLVAWSGPRRVGIAPETAGNAWAPKAYWSARRSCWLVIWASSVRGDRSSHQRLLCAPTRDFRDFGPAESYLDPGRDIIDAGFLRHGEDWYRFTATVYRPGIEPLRNFVRVERGRDLEDPGFVVLDEALGRGELQRAEGPAAFTDGERCYLLIDEFGLSGYHLYVADDPASGRWEHRADARLPEGARHGSVLPISAEERAALIAGFGT